MHVFDPYINIQRNNLEFIHTDVHPGANLVVDTSMLQLMVLEKFMHNFGYRLNHKGQFEDQNPKSPAKIVSFTTATRTYNQYFKNAPKEILENFKGLYLERVYFAGKSLRKCRVMKNKVKFI